MTIEKQWNRTEQQSERAYAPASTARERTDAKMLLRDVRHCQLRTLALCERAERYREMAMKATGRSEAFRMSGTDSRSNVEKYILELWDVHNELQKEIARLMEKSRRTEHLLHRLEDDRCRAVLEMRYLCGMTWNEIAKKLHFTVRWTHYLHKEGVEALEGMMSGSGF